jgi:hypothetical protein
LFDAIVERCVEPGAMCMSQMMGQQMGQHNAAMPHGALALSSQVKDSICVSPPVSVEANHAK